MEAVECGAASLAMVLAHHGRFVPLEELRVACGVSRDGSNAASLMRAARSYGLEAKAFKREIDALGKTMLPAILFWHFNHFVVLDGYDDDWFYISDPAAGRRRVSAQEFDEAFTGVVLEFKPGPEFRKGGEPPRLLEALRDRLRGSERAVLFALIAGLALVVPGIVVPMFSKIFVDQVLVRTLVGWVRPLLLAMAITAVVRAALVWLQQYYLLRLETKLSVTSSSRFLWHLLHLPIEFYAQRFIGEIGWRFNLNDEVARFVSRRLLHAAIDAVMIVFFAILMLTYDVWLTLVGFAAVGVLVLVTTQMNRMRVDANRRVLQEAGKATGALMAGLSSIETIKASAMESDFFARWSGYQAKFLTAQQSLARLTVALTSVPALTVALTNAIVLLVGAQRVMQGEFTLGTLVAFQTLMMSFLRPVTNFVNLGAALQDMHGKMTRIEDVLAARAEGARDDGDPADVRRLAGRVELRGVTFGYSPNAAPLLEDFAITLTPGSRVALVGPSGCGKSTIAKLVTALYPPWRGEILLDGVPLKEWSSATRAASVALVDQEISLFAGTVRENLTLWDSTVSEEALVTACKDAAIQEDIMSRPGGFEARVEESGANFSGGQRQRLEIARALVTNPSVLVLDEATSALDAVTEHHIDRSLRRRGCTCVIIAHRLSTVRDADEIIVLDRGQVVQRGTHDTLMREIDGLYASLAAEH